MTVCYAYTHHETLTLSFLYQSHKWVTMQLAGTMDIDCSKYMDWFHGGLQFQTEHHLVPRMPRHKLRKFREEVVKPFLKELSSRFSVLSESCPPGLFKNPTETKPELLGVCLLAAFVRVHLEQYLPVSLQNLLRRGVPVHF